VSIAISVIVEGGVRLQSEDGIREERKLTERSMFAWSEVRDSGATQTDSLRYMKCHRRERCSWTERGTGFENSAN